MIGRLRTPSPALVIACIEGTVVMARGEQFLREIGTDKPRAARDQYIHRAER